MNPEHLLDQADHLTAWQAVGRPRSTDLRRAVSAAYYALFHTLTAAAAAQLNAHPGIRRLLVRQYAHAQMRDVARQFANGSGGVAAQAVRFFGAIPAELRDVAKAFLELQTARHAADYDPRADIVPTRGTAEMWVATARRARTAWDAVRNQPVAEFFLLALLVKDLGRFAD